MFVGNMQLKIPILFLVFNRPDTTQKVFAAIRQAKPARLFVAADGYREDRHGEAEKCAQARSIIENVDWDCEVVTLFRENNLGCRKAVSSAIDWFFENVEEGIILEDDCLPSQSFFMYCQELLEYYRDDTRVMQICGSNFLKGWQRNEDSYYFSNYGPVWGWASWRRAWKYYDVDMKLWPEVKEKNVLEDICMSREEIEYRENLYDKVFSGDIDTWDYQWGFAKMINSGLSVITSVNLISNIGFDADATHTAADRNNPYAAMETYDIKFPLNHPRYVVQDCLADQRYLNEFMSIRSVRNSLRQTLIWLIRGTKG
jgi:hypothetical protein